VNFSVPTMTLGALTVVTSIGSTSPSAFLADRCSGLGATLLYKHISSQYKQAAVARLPSFGKMIDESEVLQIPRLEIPSLFHPKNLQ
jgi:hypothetical protein